MQDLALLLGYRWAAVYNRSKGKTSDFVLLPVFFASETSVMPFLEDFCNKRGESRFIYAPYGCDFTLAYVDDLSHTTLKYQTISPQEAERLRDENH